MERKTVWDASGNRLGEDVITTDRDGLTHITHYDNHGNRIGRSFEARDNRGEVYMIHEDAGGNRLARSTLEKDWWGDYYVKTEQTRYGREQAEAARKEAERRAPLSDADSGGAELIGDILSGFIMLILKLCAGVLLFDLVGAAGMTVWVFLLLSLPLGLMGAAPQFIIFVLACLLFLSYIPYVGILLYRRWKKEIDWKTFFRMILRWALIGPFAYRKLARAKRDSVEPPEPVAAVDGQRAFCPECGHAAAPGERFCKHCGAKLHEK